MAALLGSGYAEDREVKIRNGTVTVGVDRAKGGSITWLSWKGYRSNAVNIADPGRLIQQSYYAGQVLDRTAEGQHRAWCPWAWNPIQGGGVGSWARVTAFKRTGSSELYSETVPKLWDMPDEEAQALMRQWTSFEPGLPNAVWVRCEFVSQREGKDRWDGPAARHQEIPACYFTRNFSEVRSYLGDGRWQAEAAAPGPPWKQASPPRQAMACFNEEGQGIAVFSPAAGKTWNFGPCGKEITDSPTAGPCMHLAPLDTAAFGPQATYRYRYWLVLGEEAEVAATLDTLWSRFAGEKAELVQPP